MYIKILIVNLSLIITVKTPVIAVKSAQSKGKKNKGKKIKARKLNQSIDLNNTQQNACARESDQSFMIE